MVLKAKQCPDCGKEIHVYHNRTTGERHYSCRECGFEYP